MSDVKKQEPQNQPAVVQKAASEKFTLAVMKEFSSNGGDLSLTTFQKKLIQNYFIRLDRTLKDSEIKRLAKGQYGDPLPLTWENVNMPKLAQDVVALSLVGLDPLQSNHVNMIPYKNNSTQKYDITPLVGYRGMELKAKKYGLEIPDDVVIELVFKNDKFREIKKSVSNRVESYEFEITNSFNRGELIGGFYYFSFVDRPEKNRIRVFNREQIEKRKPDYASPEFWGGEKDEYKGGKKTGEKIKVEGWYEEMAYKTICRAAYNSITIDSEKIDEHFVRMMGIEEEERSFKQIEAPIEKMRTEVKAETVSQTVDFEDLPTKKSEEPSQDLKADRTVGTIKEEKSIELKSFSEKQSDSAINPENSLF